MAEDGKGRKRDRQGYVQVNLVLPMDLRKRMWLYRLENRFHSLSDAAEALLEHALRKPPDQPPAPPK